MTLNDKKDIQLNLATALNMQRVLKTLSLNDSTIDWRIFLDSVISFNQTLSVLDLSNNNFNDSVVQFLEPAFNRSTLKGLSLCLSENKLTDKSLIILGQIIVHNPSLFRVLALKDNSLKD